MIMVCSELMTSLNQSENAYKETTMLFKEAVGLIIFLWHSNLSVHMLIQYYINLESQAEYT